MDLLQMVGNQKNLLLLSSLAGNPEYPRMLAARLGLRETNVVQRLRALERVGVVRGEWVRQDGKNVRLYRLKTGAFTITIDQQGYRVLAPTLETSREFAKVEQVPPHGVVLGREKELDRLSDPDCRFCMVVGLAGMGKTSLGAELAHRHGITRVLWHTFTPFDTASRFLGLARRWLAGFDAKRGRTYERANWDIAEILDHVTEGLSSQSALIVLDDYQKVHDEGIHEVVRRWQRALSDSKLVVLSRTRPPFDLDSATQLIMLTGLDETAVRGLLRESGHDASPEELRRLNRAFGGHPLSLRLYAQQPGKIPGAAGSAIDDLGLEAFRSLDEKSQEVALALVAAQRPLDLNGVRLVTGLKDPTLPLATIERRAMMRSEGKVYQIHDVLRESLSGVLSSRPEIHRRATALLLPSERVEDMVEALYHATKAGDWAVVGNLLERLHTADREMALGNINQSIFLAILNEIPPEKLGSRHRVMFHLSHARMSLGVIRTFAVIRELETARRIAEQLGDIRLRSWAFSTLAGYLRYVGRAAAAERLLLRTLDLVEAEGEPAERSDVLFELAGLYESRGDRVRAREFWRRCVREAEQAGNERWLLLLKTFPIAFGYDLPRMNRGLRRWRAVFRRRGMMEQMAEMDAQIGENICRTARYRTTRPKADLQEAVVRLDRFVTRRTMLGDLWRGGGTRPWLSLALFLTKKYEDAEAVAKDVLDLDRRCGTTHCAILARQVLSRVSAHRGDFPAARKHLDEAIRVARRMHCGCLGISLVERATLEERLSGGKGSHELLSQAIAETIRMGTPDEVRYARRMLRQRHMKRDSVAQDLVIQSPQIAAIRQR